jgi:hypothetical protein
MMREEHQWSMSTELIRASGESDEVAAPSATPASGAAERPVDGAASGPVARRSPVAVVIAAILGLMSGVVITTVVRAPPLPETRFVSFDANSKVLMTAGWSNPEGVPGNSFAWCSAKTCKVTLNSRAQADRVIAFQAAPFVFPGAKPQTVKLVLNDKSLGELPFPPGVSTLRAPAPKAAWKLGQNTLSFDFAYAESPKDHTPDNKDPRQLAASFLWVAITGPD